MIRCGFDAFEVKKDADAAAFAEAEIGATACSTSRPGRPRLDGAAAPAVAAGAEYGRCGTGSVFWRGVRRQRLTLQR